MEDNRTPTGVRITTSETDGKITFYMNGTAKSGKKQNSTHTIIQPLNTRIMVGLDPTEIGEAVLSELGLDECDHVER